jgi:hypothetical protein
VRMSEDEQQFSPICGAQVPRSHGTPDTCVINVPIMRTLLALASSEEGLIVVSRLKVLVTIFFLPRSCGCFDGKTARVLKV